MIEGDALVTSGAALAEFRAGKQVIVGVEMRYECDWQGLMGRFRMRGVLGVLALGWSGTPASPGQGEETPTTKEEESTSRLGEEPPGDVQPPLEELPGDILLPLEELPGNVKWFGDLDGMKERRAIRALVAYNRGNYYYVDGRPKGIIVEALLEFERSVNQKLNPKDRTGKEKIHIVLIPTIQADMFRNLADGIGDLAVGNLSISSDRESVVDFSTPTFEGVKQLIVSGPSAARIASLDDLGGKEIWVKETSTHAQHLKQLSESMVRRGLPPIRVRAVDPQLEDDDVMEMVAGGFYDFTAMDDHVAGLWSQVFSDLKVHEDLVLFSGGKKGWALRKQCPQLKALLDEFVKENRVGTSFGNIIIRRYYRSAKYARMMGSDESARRLSRYKGLLEEYGGQYNFPALLILAVAYQESRLDPSAQSRAGAVGLMQVMPKLAAAPPVSVTDVTKVENDVHAGVRMLRFIRDDYFAAEPMDPMNKGLMTLAAYSAGPARIKSCRRMTREMGLDPSVWFSNVEMAVARKVGRETVGYVSNIYKYHLAFRLVEERVAAGEKAREGLTTQGRIN